MFLKWVSGVVFALEKKAVKETRRNEEEDDDDYAALPSPHCKTHTIITIVIRKS